MADIDISDDLNDETPLMHTGGDGTKSTSGLGIATSGIAKSSGDVLTEIRPCIAEFVGVMIFVFLGTTSGTYDSLVTAAMAHGLTILLLIIAFGDISGGHFNPCVTLGAMLGGDISPLRSLSYLLAQLVGSLIGASLTKGVLSDSEYTAIKGGIPQLGEGVTVWQGILCETTLTLLLVLTVLMVAVDRKDNILAPVAIGLAVTVDIAAAGSISGAVMNPARAFGPAVIGTSVLYKDAWTNHYVYWVGPVMGTLLAAAFYRLLLASPHKRLFCRRPLPHRD